MAKRSRRSKRNYLKRGGAPAPVQTKKVRNLALFASELTFDGVVPIRDAEGNPVLGPSGKPLVQRRQTVTWYLGYATGHFEVVVWRRVLRTVKNRPGLREQQASLTKEWSDWSRTVERRVDKMLHYRRSVRVSANQSYIERWSRVHYAVCNRKDPIQLEERTDLKYERQSWKDADFIQEQKRLTRAARKWKEQQEQAQQEQMEQTS